MSNDWGSFVADNPAGCIDRENRALRVSIVSGGGGSSTLKRDIFTPDGSTQAFTLSNAPNGVAMLFWNGLLMDPIDDYSLSGTTLTTTFTASVGDHLSAYYL